MLIFSAAGELAYIESDLGYVGNVAWKPGEKTLVYSRSVGQVGVVSYINDSWQDRPVAYEYPNSILEMAWSPDGEQMAVATEDYYVYLWEPEGTDDPQPLGAHEATISDLAWSPDASQLVASDYSGAISFWSVTRNMLRFRRNGHSDYARTLDWHPDGHTIISGGDDEMLLFWDTTGQIIGRVEFPTWVYEADFSASGEKIAVITLEDEFFLINSVSRQSESQFQLPYGIKEAAWRGEETTADPRGMLLLSYDDRATFRLEDPAQDLQQQTSFTEEYGGLRAGYISYVEWSPDGNYLAYNKDYELVIMSPEETSSFDLVGATLYNLSWHPGSSPELPQTNFLATISSDNRLLIWDVPSGTVARQLEVGSITRALTWSPNGEYIATGNDDGEIHIYNQQLELSLTVQLHLDYIRALSWSPNGRYLATASDDGTAVIFDVREREAVSVLKGHEDWVRQVLWLDDSHLATGADDAKTILWEWDASNGESRILQTLERLQGYHQAMSYLPQGRGGLLAVGSSSYEFALWNIEANWTARFDTLFQTDNEITGLSWHPKGRRSLALNSYAVFPYELGWDSKLRLAYEGMEKPVRFRLVNDALLGGGIDLFDYFYLPELKVEPRLYDQVAWSNNERWLAVIQDNGTGLGGRQVELHDLSQKKVAGELMLEASDPAHLLFSPDGRYLAISPDQGDVVVLATDSTATDTLFLEMAPADDFMAWTWSANSRYLAVLDRSYQVHVHDLETGNVQRLAGGPADYDRASISFYPLNDRWLYLFTQQGIFELDRQSDLKGQRNYEPRKFGARNIGDAPPQGEWLENGREVLYQQANNAPILLSLAPGIAEEKSYFGEYENLHAWSSTGGWLHELEPMPVGKGEYTSKELQYPRVWSIESGEVRGQLQPARRQLIEHMALSSDGKYLLTRGYLFTEVEGKYAPQDVPFIIVWDVDKQEEVFELPIPGGLMARFSPLDNYIYVYYENGRVMLWPLNTAAIGQYFAISGKDAYLEQLFPGESTGFVNRITDWELESGINFREQENFAMLYEREGARVRQNWSTYFVEQVWLEYADESAKRHFAKATNLHTESPNQSIRSHPRDTSALVNIWFEEAYFAIHSRNLREAKGYLQNVESVRPQSSRLEMLEQLLAWHEGDREPVIRTLFSGFREALVRELDNWKRRDLQLNDKNLLERYIALSTGKQDPVAPLAEPTLISTIPADLTATFRDTLIRAYYATNMQHDDFQLHSTNRYQQFLTEAANYLDQAWRANPRDLELANDLHDYNYKLQELTFAKQKTARALDYAERNVELAKTMLDLGLEPRRRFEGDYLGAAAESIFLRLQQDPSRAAALREEILALREQYPNVEVPLYLKFQQAHCELALGKTKAAYQLYYGVLSPYRIYTLDGVIAQVQREVTPILPDRWPALERVFNLYKEYRQATEIYSESRYDITDPLYASEQDLLSGNYWSVYQAGTARYEAALVLEEADMMPRTDLLQEMESFNELSASYSHVLLYRGNWKELAPVLATTQKYMAQYNWPQAMEAVVALMEGEWGACQRILRRVRDLPNDGYARDAYPRLRDYLLELPLNITESSAFRERGIDWSRLLRQ